MEKLSARELFEEAVENGDIPTREELIALMNGQDMVGRDIRDQADNILRLHGYEAPKTGTFASYARPMLSIRKSRTARSRT